jgi:RNA polymerase sigma-70 factor (ECF subfamily)
MRAAMMWFGERRSPTLYLAGSGLRQADDATLARALMAGDPGAARVTWERFAPLVERILKRDLGGWSDIEDITQDVFIKLFERITTLRDPKALKAYIVSITTLTLRDELRKRKVRRWVTLTDGPQAEDQRIVTPDPEARQALRRFYRILDRFAPEDRTIVVLRFVEGWVLAETAAAMGMSLSTAKRRLAAVWKRLSFFVARDPSLAGYMPPRPTEPEPDPEKP